MIGRPLSEDRPSPFDRVVEWAAPISGLWRTRWMEAAFVAAFLLSVTLVAGLGFVRAQPDWDAFAYTALVLEAPGDSATTLHSKGYDATLAESSPATAIALTRGDAYRTRQFEDPDAFASMLPMYRVKIGYTAFIDALDGTTSPYRVAVWLNVASVLVMALVMLTWLWRARALAAVPLLLVAMMAFDLGDMIGVMKPALPTAALTLLAFWLYREDRSWLAIVPLALATTMRPDTIILAFALLIAFGLMGRRTWPLIAGFAVTIAIYVAASSGTEHIGWWPHYYFSNVKYQQTLEGFDPSFSILAYLTGIARGGFMTLAQEVWGVVALAVLACLVAMLRAGIRIERLDAALLLACLLAVGGKFVAFPLPDGRIYLPMVLAAATVLADSYYRAKVPRTA